MDLPATIQHYGVEITGQRGRRGLRRVLSKPEIIRCLKRYLAREIYHLLPPSAALDDPVPIRAKMAA